LVVSTTPGRGAGLPGIVGTVVQAGGPPGAAARPFCRGLDTRRGERGGEEGGGRRVEGAGRNREGVTVTAYVARAITASESEHIGEQQQRQSIVMRSAETGGMEEGAGGTGDDERSVASRVASARVRDAGGRLTPQPVLCTLGSRGEGREHGAGPFRCREEKMES
jgi:hypothetical protein